MANKLLAKRNAGQVSIKWLENFIRRTPLIKTYISRLYNYQRVKCEDLEVISAWFRLVEAIKAKYSITNNDSYNFNKTGF